LIATSPLAQIGLEAPKIATRHVHKTLPPTLSGFPGEAEIRYFVKATVGRQSFFKENPRAYAPYNFFPIEPPRPAPTGSQVYARQRHAFTPFPEAPVKEKMKSFFGKKPSEPTPRGADAPLVSVDARLPEPAVLTCNQDIPLSILVKRLNASTDAIYMQSLQVSLNANTKVRAHDVFRTEQNSWIIMSKSNMGVLIGSKTDSEGTEVAIDDSLWRGQVLPNTVAPSFETCNIARSYCLDVRIGLSCSGPSHGGKVSKSYIQPIVSAAPMVCLRQGHITDYNYSRKMSFCHFDSTSRCTRVLHRRRKSWSAWPKFVPTRNDRRMYQVLQRWTRS
jgi:hypothetical protein